MVTLSVLQNMDEKSRRLKRINKLKGRKRRVENNGSITLISVSVKGTK